MIGTFTADRDAGTHSKFKSTRAELPLTDKMSHMSFYADLVNSCYCALGGIKHLMIAN